MNNKKKNLIFRKHKGNLADMLGTGLCIIVLLTILMAMVHYMQVLYVKRDVANIGREYLLILEEKGELTPADIQNCKDKIESMGFHTYTITYNGDNHKKIYGQEVSIDIVITASRQEMKLTALVLPGLSQSSYTLTSKLYSIAKH